MAIEACDYSGAWEWSVELLGAMKENDLPPSSFPYSSVVSACDRDHQWTRVLELFQEMQEYKVELDAVTYSLCMGGSGRVETRMFVARSRVRRKVGSWERCRQQEVLGLQAPSAAPWPAVSLGALGEPPLEAQLFAPSMGYFNGATDVGAEAYSMNWPLQGVLWDSVPQLHDPAAMQFHPSCQ
ncbi:unnamed protein product, partial [Prorocentrum cordatum]